MTGLVEQLQSESLDPTVSVSTLLRKVKLAAVKLQQTETIQWVDAELTGYTSDVPNYRILHGTFKARNPYSDWEPVIGAPKIIQALSQRAIGDPVSSIEATLAEGAGGSFTVSAPPSLLSDLRKANPGMTDAQLFIGRGQLVALVDRVRNMVFEWALDLEKAGILGDGISFSSQEKERASAAQIHIGTFSGNFHSGDISGTNARANLGSQDISSNVVTGDSVFAQLASKITDEVAETSEQQRLLRLVREMEAAKGSDSFVGRYREFMAVAADHIGVLGPLLPALATFLPG